MRFKFVIFISLLLGACGTGNGMPLKPYVNADAEPSKFFICHGYGCTHRTYVSLSEDQWRSVLEIFKKKPQNAQEERQNIAQAMGLLETYAHKSSNLPVDLGEARTKIENQGQMDCRDETINTSQYLRFLEEEGIFVFHSVNRPVHRGFFIDGMWPHNSAAIREKATGTIYAVDTYYDENGHAARIVELDIWLKNWRPFPRKPRNQAS